MLVDCSFLILFLFSAPRRCNAYDFVREYSGVTFFDEWDFYGSWDNLTLGDTWWVNENDAFTQGLAYVNSAGNAVIRVDSTTNVPFNIKRNSVRITSQATYNYGSLWIIDLVHIPFGCSVWPAFWSFGANWPSGGEIDIIEGVNLMPTNQVSLHTLDGCVIAAPPDIVASRQTETNCSSAPGCTQIDNRPASYGAQFAQNGGGVWATQFDVTGIFIWFWPRNEVPPTIQNVPLDVSTWGVPTASFPNSSSCPMTQYFGPQQLVLDITLCGVLAGLPVVYQPTCGSQGPTQNCYLDTVMGPGERYNDAYFEVSYIKTFTTGAPAPLSTSPQAASAGTSQVPSSSAAISFGGHDKRYYIMISALLFLSLFLGL